MDNYCIPYLIFARFISCTDGSRQKYRKNAVAAACTASKGKPVISDANIIGAVTVCWDTSIYDGFTIRP